MTLRKWFHLFWTTLLLGIVLGLAAGLILSVGQFELAMPGLRAIGFNMLYMILVGATVSILSQMGYFAFLIVRYVGLGIIRNKKTWDLLQWALVVIAMFELVSLRYIQFGGSWFAYVPLAAVMLAVSLLVAYWKVKLTNANGFLPTLFYMYVVTILEAIPALRTNNASGIFFMLVPLLGCNAWQILILPRILQNQKEPAAADSK
ncbi:KinB signaling pathway activation protein [Gordoniibacillus kamchatkensis]|uniref:KinB signaling pathway activation protein n=1 Tax=Gordoniibacillus kamchatkensis TaxID=1590651 RepID=A0ABR5AFA2_9BACL|nr:KinB-signaling pathway activation protein [Paenibacillus sp. VKM B-2647]KIL39735.1 KinB signaling pathway activation protein [Paenibacillus sp. VKM B-2647]